MPFTVYIVQCTLYTVQWCTRCFLHIQPSLYTVQWCTRRFLHIQPSLHCTVVYTVLPTYTTFSAKALYILSDSFCMQIIALLYWDLMDKGTERAALISGPSILSQNSGLNVFPFKSILDTKKIVRQQIVYFQNVKFRGVETPLGSVKVLF